MKRSHILLGAAMVLTLLIRIVDPLHRNEPPLVAEALVTSRSPSDTHAAAVPAGISGPSAGRQRIEREPIDPFAPPAPVTPPPDQVVTEPVKAPPPPPPPPPTAPPLPYTAIGDWKEDGQTLAVLVGPQGTILAHTGDTLASQYHVDHIQPGLLSMTYLPLHQAQQLSWRSAQ